MSEYYDFDGNPMSLEDWGRAFEQFDGRKIGNTQINGCTVSTVWLGIDHSFGQGGPPLIFETMIFDHRDEPELDEWCMRYATKEEAVKGHWEAVQLVAGPNPSPEDMQRAAKELEQLVSSLIKAE